MKKVLIVLGGGIGNIVQATPMIQAVANENWTIDLKLECNSTTDVFEIFKLPCVRKIVNKIDEKYDYQLNGPFTSSNKYNCKKFFRPKINYAQHIPEAKIYYNLAVQMGITSKMPDSKIKIPKSGYDPPADSIAIYPGSKHNWAMKRWDKYDVLSKNFKNVVVVGTKKDIESHGNPTWIKKKWNWSDNVEFYHGTLSEQAYLISKCKAFIGNDGGLSHVAAATGTPTFVLFGPSSDVKNKPFNKNAYVISVNLPCRPCQFNKGPDGKQIFGSDKGNCYLNMKCMKEMSVDYVTKKIKEKLN